MVKPAKVELVRRGGPYGRNVERYSGFPDRESMLEWVKDYQDKWFVYFPRFSKVQQDEDGTWSVHCETAASCD